MTTGETTMSEDAGKQEPPTYFANIVTMQVNADETVLEFRRIITPHREQLKVQPSGGVIQIPAPTAEKIFEVDPVARVVLTYSAVKGLRENLNSILPGAEKARKTGELSWQQP